jgi:hypothetical protein
MKDRLERKFVLKSDVLDSEIFLTLCEESGIKWGDGDSAKSWTPSIVDIIYLVNGGNLFYASSPPDNEEVLNLETGTYSKFKAF